MVNCQVAKLSFRLRVSISKEEAFGTKSPELYKAPWKNKEVNASLFYFHSQMNFCLFFSISPDFKKFILYLSSYSTNRYIYNF